MNCQNKIPRPWWPRPWQRLPWWPVLTGLRPSRCRSVLYWLWLFFSVSDKPTNDPTDKIFLGSSRIRHSSKKTTICQLCDQVVAEVAEAISVIRLGVDLVRLVDEKKIHHDDNHGNLLIFALFTMFGYFWSFQYFTVIFAGEIHRRRCRRILWHWSRGLQSQRRPWRGSNDHRLDHLHLKLVQNEREKLLLEMYSDMMESMKVL